jgi:alkyl sulfatase BDS1-like metallo-beta-lactamase superfamily hydrolase
MTDIRDLCEQLWTGTADTAAVHPVTTEFREGVEIADGVLFYKGFASVNTFDTGAGLLMVDTGGRNETRSMHEAVRRWRPETPLTAAVWSHHHVDHIFGVGPFEADAERHGWSPPRVYAHEHVRRNLERYERTAGWNTAINQRQFAFPADRFRWPVEYRYPDEEIGREHRFAVGDEAVEVYHARGETEDNVWTWLPGRRVLCPGDLFIWATPNCGNPQKVQRYPGEWAAGLRAMAAVGAEVMLPGHGLPIFGAGRVRQALTDTATLLESIEAQVLALMNEGKPLDTVLHAVEFPADLLEKPYLRPVYDEPQFIVRTVWRQYGGWYDGEPDNLMPAPRSEQAREWVTLAGGLRPVLDRAAALLAEGNLRLACHLIEYAVIAEPGSAEAHELRAEIYGRRSRQQTSTMGRNILNHAALASHQGKRDLAGDY